MILFLLILLWITLAISTLSLLKFIETISISLSVIAHEGLPKADPYLRLSNTYTIFFCLCSASSVITLIAIVLTILSDMAK